MMMKTTINIPKKSNNYITTYLNFQSPNQVVEKYLGVM